MPILPIYNSIGFPQTKGAPLLGEAPLIGRLRYSSSCVGMAKFGCHEVWNLSREVIPLTHSDMEDRSTLVYTCMSILYQHIHLDL